MVKCLLSIAMGKKKVTIEQVSQATGISRNTISKLYHDKDLTGIKFDTLEKLCEYFGCNISDLLVLDKDNQD